MRKLTGGLIALICLLVAFASPAAAQIDISVPSAGEACSSDLDCADNETCIDDICIPSVGDPCSSDLDCADNETCINDICVPSFVTPCSSDLDCAADEFCIDNICVPSAGLACTNDLQCALGQLCIDEICREAECETNADCDEGLICDNATRNPTYMCVECLADSDCEIGQYCTDNNTCSVGDDCELVIKPKRVNIGKKKSPEFVVKKLKFKGNENFVIPLNEFGFFDQSQCDFGPFVVAAQEIRTKRNKLRVVAITYPAENEPGIYQLRIGSCIGEIELYDKKAAKAAKKAAKLAEQ